MTFKDTTWLVAIYLQLIIISRKDPLRFKIALTFSRRVTVAQGLADSPNFSSSKNPCTFSQIIKINE